jgi:hypothetical protein
MISAGKVLADRRRKIRQRDPGSASAQAALGAAGRRQLRRCRQPIKEPAPQLAQQLRRPFC